MTIHWHGQSCFQISITQGKNNQVKIVIDPFSEEIGLRLPKLESDILLVSHDHHNHNNVKAVSAPTSASPPFLIQGPGEYEVKKVFIQGIPSFHDDKGGKERGENTIYTIEAEDLRLCHLGDLGQKELTEEQLEQIGDIDILMIPVGGVYTISAKEALKMMSQIEPKIIIPMHYQIPERQRRVEMKRQLHRPPKLKVHPVKSPVKLPAAEFNRGISQKAKSFNGVKLDGIDKFLKALGIKSITPESKLSIKKKDISLEEAKIIVLKP